eukprot:TRINITY_DN5444_c1_g1_i1.p1 TRINITY_DN5444_c1_g1~~TRINITY_DN5444_c1_g1_i1.p1  ORF type:complete len:789 (+),score=124.29 TRINITY_DN5444_c1_g1_i1:51-2369(+)
MASDEPSLAEQHAFLDAAKARDFVTVRQRVQERPRLINCQPATRWSALHQAAGAGNAETVSFLLARGASVNVLTSDGKTPRDVAQPSVRPLLLRASLAEGIKARIRALYTLVNASKLDGLGALFEKHEGREKELFQKIVKKYEVKADILRKVDAMAASASADTHGSSNSSSSGAKKGKRMIESEKVFEAKVVFDARRGTYEKQAMKDAYIDSKRHRTQDNYHGTSLLETHVESETDHVAEVAVSNIKAAITAKKDWKAKVMSADIVDKWRKEATSQGANPLAFEKAVSQLKNDDYYTLSGIIYKDGLLPTKLKSQIIDCLDRLAAKSVDFHPYSENMVRNVIHPSLYCYVHGQSWVNRAPPVDAAAKPDGLRFAETERNKLDRFAHCLVGVKEWSRYQWLPSEFDVDSEGRATLASYVNGAPHDVDLRKTLEETFSSLIPSFEQVVTPPGSRKLVSLRKKRLQVIVKAANYELKPGQTYDGGWHVEGMLHERIVAAGIVYYDASSNMRGDGLAFRRLRNRNVVGAAKIPTKNLGGNDYGDRSDEVSVAVSDAQWQSYSGADSPKHSIHGDEQGEDSESEEEEDEDEDDDEKKEHVPTGFIKPKYQLSGDDIKPASLWDVRYQSHRMSNYVDLGVIETPPSRVIVFKNSMQHRVTTLWNSSSTDIATRKVLIFWLIDPDKRILSTADVPQQQWDAHRAYVGNMLRHQWRGVSREAKISVDALKLILDYAKHGFTEEEARQNRLKLMEERKFSRVAIDKKFIATIEQEYSFCEH